MDFLDRRLTKVFIKINRIRVADQQGKIYFVKVHTQSSPYCKGKSRQRDIYNTPSTPFTISQSIDFQMRTEHVHYIEIYDQLFRGNKQTKYCCKGKYKINIWLHTYIDNNNRR